MNHRLLIGGIVMALGSGPLAAANIVPAEIGKTLTAAGSPMAADGPIPAFEGRDQPLPGWSIEKSRTAFWKYHDEKPLFTIDASNAAQHAEQLTPGQLALFKVNPEYKMVVYPTHRTCSYPDFVVENTRQNVGSAKLTASGNGIASGTLPGIPFPGTSSGLEAIWNHLMRYSGVGMDSVVRTVVSPRPGSSGFIDTAAQTTLFMPLNAKGQHSPSEGGGNYLNGFVQLSEPPAMAGQAMIQKSMFDADQETFMYFPGQRRVRRMPTYAYDAPMLGYENQIMIDASFTFNGNPDRFDWKMVGEKNILVPYNAFGMYDQDLKQSDVVTPKSVSPAVRRYELHKVYVVEATVRQGVRHSTPKRTFYLDSDTYLALVADDYDAQGKLWKVRESYPMPVWEVEGACASIPYAQYDLENGRYIADFIVAGNPSKKGIEWFLESDKTRFRSSFYTQDNLRSISER
ncbi:DUF1329 domain-containing protein [Pseudomonas sp. LRF_L74]|uniref:DUF1329 domain-containing protein n=1 Tax=Pseudomonas sp. LRF_L74 TaxID=3369422 RepID=UPI003F616858